MLDVKEALELALPTIKSTGAAADFTRTVLPFKSQLQELPSRLLQHWSDHEELKAIYLSTNPLISAFALSLFLAPLFLAVSEVNRNYSQVDRLWSILPSIYNAHFCAYAHLAGMHTERLDTLLAFSVIWSVSQPT